MEPFGRNCSVFTEKRRTRYIPQSGLCVSYAPLRNYFTSGFESSAVPTAICVGEDLAYSEFQPTEQAAGCRSGLAADPSCVEPAVRDRGE